MKKLLVAVVVACGFAAFANEWYIDPTNGVDTAAGTQDAPRKTLKGAMEIPELAANDTIWLLPGEYAEGTMGDLDSRRLYITVAGLRFRSTAGRDRTFIVGQHDGTKGYNGEGAVGCVTIAKSAKNCVFEGITFRDGAARYFAKSDPRNDDSGGGLYDISASCWVIGCRFSNCIAYATAGAMKQGNASGTEFVDCSASNGSSQFVQSLTYAEFCFFYGGSANASIDYGGTFVNCTFHGKNVSKSQLFYRQSFRLYNCLAYGFKTSCGSHQSSTGTPTPSDVTITNTYFNIYDGNGSLTVGANSLTNADETTVRFVAPAAGDFRLTDDSDAKELGDAAYLTLLPATFPEGFERKDVYGNPVTVTSGAIPAGCALEVPHRTYGRVDFTKAFEVQEFGCSFAAGTYFNPISEDYTYMFRPVTDDVIHNVQGIFGKELNANKTAWVDLSRYFFPLRRKGGWVPVGVRKELISTNKFTWTSVAASSAYYADPVNGSDDYDGKSPEVISGSNGPFKTLMGAMKKIDTGSSSKILFLLPGTYNDGQTGVKNTSNGTAYRVCVTNANIAIVGLEGPEKTFIVGAPDPDTGGMGPNAVGGVWLKSGTCRCVQDVTITGCYASGVESTSYAAAGCAFYGGGSPTTHCRDCIISNNTAYVAPVKSYGTMSRCWILNNHSTVYMCTKGDPVSSSVFAGNEITATKTADKQFADTATYGCTFDAKVSGSLSTTTYYSLFLNRKQSGSLNQSYNDMIPLVADPDAFDYRLGSLSPAVLFGDLSARTAGSAYYLVCDINGDKFEIKDGKMTVGAVHSGPRVPCVAITGSNGGSVTVVGGEAGTNLVTSTDPITVTASFSRPFLHFEKNGEQVTPFGQMSYTFSPSDELDAATVVKAVYGTNWYVNASATSDEGLGSTWETARQTIRSATTNAVAGDVIHVAPGEYGEAEGSRLQSSVQTRVIVPANVRLQGEGAPYAAVIRGAAASEPENEYGMGADAVRCVYLSAGATLANFTLTEGHTVTSTSGRGSAVFAANNTTATVVDCLVTNNYCYDGTMYSGRIVKCRVIDNTSTHYGSLGYACSYYGCFLDHSWTKSGRALNAATSIDFCTIGTHHKFGMSTKQVLAPPGNGGTSPHPPIRNSVLEWGSSWAANMWSVSNSIFVSDYAFSDTNKCLIMSAAKMKLSDDGVPTADSPLNNWGNMEFAPDCINETDLAGVPRVLNGGVDAGAFEHDWRVEYKNDLGPRATAVTAASPEVVETEDGTVRIPAGALEGTFKPGALQLNFTLKGGTLDVYLGGELVETFEATDAVELSKEIWPSDENNAFRLAFTPNAADGYAEIARLKKGANGIIFIVR